MEGRKHTHTHAHTHTPFTLARRICDIVENSEVRKKRLDELQKVLYFQEYPQNLIQEAIRKATNISIENLRASKAINLLLIIWYFLQFSIQIIQFPL